MPADRETQIDGAPAPADSAGASPVNIADPLAEVRNLKRIVQVGVYGAIIGSEPFYYFVLHYSVPQLFLGLAIGLIIAFTAIEFAFGQIFKLRKRSAYPNVVLVELGGASASDDATGPAIAAIRRLLKATSAFLACSDADGALVVKTASGVDPEDAQTMLATFNVDSQVKNARPARAGAPPNSFTALDSGRAAARGRIVFVPVVSLESTLGVLCLVGSQSNADLKDDQLLQAIGMALGLSLDNLNQKEELREGEAKTRLILDSALDAIITIDDQGRVMSWNPQAETTFGWSQEEAVGRPLTETIIPERYRQAHSEGLKDFLASGEGPVLNQRIEVEACHRDGHEFPIELSIVPSLTPKGYTFSSFIRDITDRRRAEAALQSSESRFRALIERSSDGIALVDAEGTIVYAGPSTSRILGYSSDELIGADSLTFVHPDDVPAVIARRTETRLNPGDGFTSEHRFKHKDGSWRWLESSATNLLDEPSVGAIVINYRDVTERKQAEDTIRHQAYHDALTGLPNRALFEDRLEQAIAHASRAHEVLAVMFLDIDRFKTVNDLLGHPGGDQLLRQVGAELNALVREGDTVARVGGDEFVFLLTGLAKAEDAISAAERVIASVKEPRLLEGHEFRVSTSVGITVCPKDAEDTESLLRNADTAMYRAKERGRDNYQFYNPSMEASLLQRLSLENELRHALERDQMLVYYQPVLDIPSGRIIGSEALVRWQHHSRGLVAPDDFISLAEESGMISDLGEWVLRSACLQSKAWRNAEGDPLRLTVNISARQLEREGLVAMVQGVLKDTSFPANCLHLEITEGAMMKNVEFIIATLEDLKDMGVGITVDDFGTGYSSLSYLKRFPINTIKIDRSFVRDIPADVNDAAIVTTVITMAHSLNLTVIAEGVETQDQLQFLSDKGCDAFQGYLLSEPVPGAEFEKLLRRINGPRARILPLKSTRAS